MQIHENYDLTKLNTFGVKANTRFFAEIKDEGEIPELFNTTEFKENKKFFLGGGSNILFTCDFEGMVVKNSLKGIEIIEKNEMTVVLKSFAGESWNNLVDFAVENNLWGIENLALIPGTVGGAPVQNIGAYGAELADVLTEVEGFDIDTGDKRKYSKAECGFGYRDSIFKKELKGKFFISAVTVELSVDGKPNTTYRALAEYIEKNNVHVSLPKDVRDAVVSIRKSKLPNPLVLPNAGSFFKNIYIDEEKKNALLGEYPDMPVFYEDNNIKIPAGWLIEKCGWKGRRMGNVGVHENQALVLVNYGGATGGDVLELSKNIIKDVYEKFGLELVPEVNIV